ncbi:uncharacterized protein ATNIH1004_011764 [Aspergillus tanneri]|uniref:Uncharacterized protein n=1 Tax=Aspergillus tanneri TaxID=1220188 RepID=A0A5M9M4D8_9EURO|nr:uncharacterized protein ATNIH1004_011764 [Aspergillus tanneri]KAA8641628.1 hypothetical protein ATNIH1004_011764 [Aspergillus tanneri]
MLAMEPAYCEGFQALLDPSKSAFVSPQAALDIIKQFQQRANGGISLEQLLFLTGNDRAMRVRALDPARTNDEKAIAREKTLNARHVFFLQHVIGLLQARLASDAVLQSLTPLFPDSNAAVLSLLPGTVRGPKSQDTSPTRKLFWIS